MNSKSRLLHVCVIAGLIVPLLLAGPSTSWSQTAEEYIDDGETALFSDNIADLLEAHNIFQEAKGAYPNHPVINAYLAVTRLLDFALREDGTGLTDLLAEYGVSRSGDSLDALEFQPTLLDDQYWIIPKSAPSGERVRSFLADTALVGLDASIENLDKTLEIWGPLDKHIVPKDKIDGDLDLEWDYGDILLIRALLKAAKAMLLVMTAYDLDVDIREVIALANLDALHMGKLLDRYQDLLKLLPTTTTLGDGAAQLAEARETLISAIEDYLVASENIRDDKGGTNPGAEELIVIEDCNLLEEEFLRQMLEGLRDSLQGGTVFEIIEREETWVFTEGETPYNRLRVKLIDNRSEGEFWGLDGTGFISGNGGVECVLIKGDEIELRFVASGWLWADVTFQGTLNTERTQITDGTYSGWNSAGPVLGTFSAQRTGVDEEIMTVNFNPFFGNGSDPYHARDFLPDFDCLGDPVTATVGYGLGNDATLGGILPDFTQDDWGLEGPPASCEIPGPLSSITVNLDIPAYDGTGLIILAVFRDDGGFNPIQENRVGDFIFIYPGDDYESVVLTGLPVGETVWVSVRWDADFNGIRTRGDYSRSAGPITVAGDGSTVVTVTANSMYAGDQESPYFRNCTIHRYRTSTSVWTSFFVEVYDPNGAVPDTIRELRVTKPGGATLDLSAASVGPIYFYRESAEPQVGQYTFTVTDTQGLSATSHLYYGGGPVLPVPDASTLQASGSESGATLSWGALQNYQGNVFYRARISGQAGNTIWTSAFTSGTSVSVPGNVIQQLLQAGGSQWHVEVFDNYNFYASYHRSETAKKRLDPSGHPSDVDNATPYFDNAVIYHGKDNAVTWTQAEVFVKDPDGTLPGSTDSIQALDVYNPSNQKILTLSDFNYLPGFNVFFKRIQGSLPAGVYRFEVRDDLGNSKTTYDYLGPAIDIPRVDSATYQATGNPLAPMLSWAAPAGMDRPIYYQVVISSGQGRAWASSRIADTSVQVPSDVLMPGVSYTWYVSTQDSKYYGHFDNQGRAASVPLTMNPSPKPYFRWAGVHRRHDADGSFTAFSAAVIDPAGTLPGSLTSLTVQSPLGNTRVLVSDGELAKDVSYSPYWGEFFLRATGAFEPGLYTFILVKDDFTLVSHDWVEDTPEMPLVDQRTIAVSGDPAAPTVSWSGVSGFEGNVYYRLRVDDTMGNLIHMTSREAVTAQTIPLGKLEPDKFYIARVEAQEHPDWVTYNTRSNTAFVWFSAEGAILTGITGRITDELGIPVGNCHVYATDYYTNDWIGGVNTTPSGTYILLLPGERTYRVRACPTCSNLMAYVDEFYDDTQDYNAALPVFVATGQLTPGIDFELSFQEVLGDLNGDGFVTLADAIVGLQVLVGLTPENVNYGADVNEDGKLGLAEVIYVLQLVAGLR